MKNEKVLEQFNNGEWVCANDLLLLQGESLRNKIAQEFEDKIAKSKPLLKVLKLKKWAQPFGLKKKRKSVNL